VRRMRRRLRARVLENMREPLKFSSKLLFSYLTVAFSGKLLKSCSLGTFAI
jgi:hypothetical protein